MRKWTLAVTVVAAVTVILWLTGCRQGEKIPSPKLAAFEEAYFSSLFSFYPTLASAQGLHQFDGRLENINPITVSRRIDDLTRTLFYIRIPLHALGRSMRWDGQSASSRLKSALLSVHETQAVMASMRANIAEAPKQRIAEAVAACTRLERLLDVDFPRWGKTAAGVDKRLADSVRAALPDAQRAVKTSLGWLKTELPASGNDAFVLGPELFAKKLLVEAMVDTPPADLLAAARADLDKNYGEFLAVAARLRPGIPPGEVFRSLTASPVPPEEIVFASQRSLATIRAFLTRTGIIPLPSNAQVTVVPTPAYAATPLHPFLVDLPPVFGDDPANAVLLATAPPDTWPAELRKEYGRQFTPEQIELAVIHQTLPGRYLRVLRSRQYPTRAGRLWRCRVSCDGWSHYVEEVLIEAGFGGNDPRIRLAALQRALVRDCRFIASVKIHTQGAGIEEMTRLFTEKAFLGKALARQEAVRGLFDPGYLSDSLGKLLILKLRDDYEKVRGPAYRIEEFHDRLLSQGSLPISLIRKQLLPGDQGPLL